MVFSIANITTGCHELSVVLFKCHKASLPTRSPDMFGYLELVTFDVTPKAAVPSYMYMCVHDLEQLVSMLKVLLFLQAL